MVDDLHRLRLPGRCRPATVSLGVAVDLDPCIVGLADEPPQLLVVDADLAQTMPSPTEINARRRLRRVAMRRRAELEETTPHRPHRLDALVH